MDKEQREYAVQRLTFIECRKMDEIYAKYELSTREKLDLICSGKVKLRKKPAYCTFAALYDFSKFIPKGDKDKELAEVESEYCRIKDQLYLGDAGDALKLIREFEK